MIRDLWALEESIRWWDTFRNIPIFHFFPPYYINETPAVRRAPLVAEHRLCSFIFRYVAKAPLGWLWQGPPNVRRWPMLRSQAARPECVWPGWKVPFRPGAASLPLAPLHHWEPFRGKRGGAGGGRGGGGGVEKKKIRVELKYEDCCAISPAWMCKRVTHIIRNVCKGLEF